MIKSFWKTTKPFLIPFIIVWIFLLCVALLTQKTDLHLKINQYHSVFADFFFSHYTEVGGAFVFLVIIVLLFYKYSVALFVFLSQFITFCIIYPLKYIFSIDRPLLAFEKMEIMLHQLEKFFLKDSLSFPSGHTGAAFALFLSLCIFVKSPIVKFLFFIFAALVGYSRVYLSQHFTEDVLGGSAIGVLGVLITYLAFYQKIIQNPKLDKSVRDAVSFA